VCSDVGDVDAVAAAAVALSPPAAVSVVFQNQIKIQIYWICSQKAQNQEAK